MIYWMRPRPAPWRKALTAWMLVASAVALMLDVKPAKTQTPLDLYRERVAMSAAGAQCRLFGADLSAALRAGYMPQALASGAEDARAQVSRMACNSGRVQDAAARARDAFRVYSGLQRMVFPGDLAAWRADRAMPMQSASWRLAQDAWAGEDKVVFGMAGLHGADKAVEFRFPAAAEQALEHLDPREAVSVEILYPSDRGDLVRTAFLEVGDFDAGMAFLKTGVDG